MKGEDGGPSRRGTVISFMLLIGNRGGKMSNELSHSSFIGYYSTAVHSCSPVPTDAYVALAVACSLYDRPTVQSIQAEAYSMLYSMYSRVLLLLRTVVATNVCTCIKSNKGPLQTRR